MVEVQHPVLSVSRQGRLLGLPRASYYHRPRPEPKENLRLMRLINETYLAYPFSGAGRWPAGSGGSAIASTCICYAIWQ